MLHIIYYFQNISSVERKVKELQDSVHQLMADFVIVDNSDEAIAKAGKGIERDIKDLLRCARLLNCITRRLFTSNYVTALWR